MSTVRRTTANRAQLVATQIKSLKQEPLQLCVKYARKESSGMKMLFQSETLQIIVQIVLPVVTGTSRNFPTGNVRDLASRASTALQRFSTKKAREVQRVLRIYKSLQHTMVLKRLQVPRLTLVPQDFTARQEVGIVYVMYQHQ